MSALAGSPVPSTNLLRFLRSQTATICYQPHPQPVDFSHRLCCSWARQRHLSSTTHRSSRSPPSYIDDLFSRNREKCRALPAPKIHPSSTLPNRTRYVSSDTSPTRYEKPSLWNRIFHRQRIRNDQSTHENDPNRPLPDYSFSNHGSYEETSAQLFNLSRALSRNPAGNELKLRCTEFDKNGSVTLVSGEFKKSELIAKYGLLPRDLRKIDSSIIPHILVRPTAILLNLLHLRVLIQSDRVLVFDAYGSTDSYTQSLFMYDLEGKLRQKISASAEPASNYLPYEFRALEAVLISVTSGLEAEFASVREPVTHILRALEEDIDREKLRHLLIHSKKLGTFEQKARLVRDALYELLEADDDLASMYLTERKVTGKPRAEQEHTEIEMLLESYHKICDEVVEISGNLISNIRNTEEVVKAILDANRNQLMLFEIKVSIVTLGLAGGTLVAGFYGMNLENFIEETNWGFAAVTSACVGFSLWLSWVGMKKLRRVQKVRMWNEGGAPDLYSNPALIGRATANIRRDAISAGGSSRGNWKSEAFEAISLSHERKMKMDTRYGINASVGSSAGPVLWPGMDGLGLHKLNTATAATSSAGMEDTNSDSDDYVSSASSGSKLNSDSAVGGSSTSPMVAIKDDTGAGSKQ